MHCPGITSPGCSVSIALSFCSSRLNSVESMSSRLASSFILVFVVLLPMSFPTCSTRSAEHGARSTERCTGWLASSLAAADSKMSRMSFPCLSCRIHTVLLHDFCSRSFDFSCFGFCILSFRIVIYCLCFRTFHFLLALLLFLCRRFFSFIFSM